MGLFKKLKDFGKRVVSTARNVAQRVAPIVQRVMPIVQQVAPMFGPKGQAIASGLGIGSQILSGFAGGNSQQLKDGIKSGLSAMRSRISSPRIGLRDDY